MSGHPRTFATEPFLLNNCGLPWNSLYFNNTGGVRLSKDEQETHRLFDFETVEMKENRRNKTLRDEEQCREKYIKVYSDTQQTKYSNVDKIYVVRIPYLKNISCLSDTYKNSIVNNAVECWGLEFYKAGRFCFFGMLVLIEKGGKTIDDYVEQISHYVRFDPDFKLE